MAVQLGIPRGGLVGDEIGLQRLSRISERAAYNLFHLTFMQINAGSEHGATIMEEWAMTNAKSPTA